MQRRGAFEALRARLLCVADLIGPFDVLGRLRMCWFDAPRARVLDAMRVYASIALLACTALFVTSTDAQAQTSYFLVQLDGAQETPPGSSTGTGLGYLVLDQTAHTLAFNLSFANLNATETAAHIHGYASAGSSAAILHALPLGSPKIGSIVTTPSEEAGILADLTYVNIHSSSAPGGEIRGQIVRTSQFFLRATLDGAQEVPPLVSNGSGTGCFVLDTNAHTLRYHVEFQGLSAQETVAHIHGFAAPGSFAGVLFNMHLGSPSDDVVVITPTWEQNFLAGLGYVNVHSLVYLNGEIRGQMLLANVPQPTYVCVGDGSGTACPCGNASAIGSKSGCLHSFGLGGKLRVTGIASLACDTVSLALTDLPSASSVLVFQGTTAAASGGGNVFGDGLRCASGSVLRLGTRVASGGFVMFPSAGVALHTAGLINTPVTRVYQGWFRNSAAFCTSSTFNLTNGASLTWVP